MSPASNIASISRCLAYTSALAMAALPLIFIYGWYLVINGGSSSAIAMPVTLLYENIQMWQWAVAILITAVPVVALLPGLYRLSALMKGFALGHYFLESSVQNLYRFCFWLLISTLLKIVSIPLLSLALTINNPAGQRSIVVTVDGQMLSILFIAGIFFVISRILKEGQKIAQENAEFV